MFLQFSQPENPLITKWLLRIGGRKHRNGPRLNTAHLPKNWRAEIQIGKQSTIRISDIEVNILIHDSKNVIRAVFKCTFISEKGQVIFFAKPETDDFICRYGSNGSMIIDHLNDTTVASLSVNTMIIAKGFTKLFSPDSAENEENYEVHRAGAESLFCDALARQISNFGDPFWGRGYLPEDEREV